MKGVVMMITGVIVGTSFIIYGIYKYFMISLNYTFNKTIESYNISFLAPEKELRFIIKVLVSYLITVLGGCIIIAIDLSKYETNTVQTEVFTVVVSLIIITLEVLFKNIIYNRIYEKYRGGSKGGKVNYYEM